MIFVFLAGQPDNILVNGTDGNGLGAANPDQGVAVSRAKISEVVAVSLQPTQLSACAALTF